MSDNHTFGAGQKMAQEIAAAREAHLLDQVRIEFRFDQRVTARRPRWMPDRVYRWLWSTILVEETPPTFIYKS